MLLIDVQAIWVGLKWIVPGIVQHLENANAEIPGHFRLVLRAANLLYRAGIVLYGGLVLLLVAWLIAELLGPRALAVPFRAFVIVAGLTLTIAVLCAGASTASVLHW